MANAAPFTIRGSHFNMVTLQLRDGAPATVLPALKQLIRQSPAFLNGSPVVLGLDELPANGAPVDFAGLANGLRELKLVPIGTAGGTSSLRKAAAEAGLAQLTKGQQLFRENDGNGAASRRRVEAPVEAAPELEPVSVAAPEPAPPEPAPAEASAESPPAKPQPAMIVNQPVRAGSRIYAQGRDLICTATVNAGAEIIADGNVHVYGTLRGRAIAGASGFDEARIFALDFDPELVAIAGLYRVRDALDPTMIGQGVQVSLHGEEMRLAKL